METLERARATLVFGWHNLTCHIMTVIALVRDQPRFLIQGGDAHDLTHGALATRTLHVSSLLSGARHELSPYNNLHLDNFMLLESFQNRF